MAYRYLLFLFMCFFWASCTKEANYSLVNTPPMVLGHGGMGISSIHPMNTLESIIQAINSGADGTEIDIQMSKDGFFIAYRDSDIRDSDDNLTSIYGLTAGEINQLFINSSFNGKYKIYSVDQIFNEIDLGKIKRIVFDFKLPDGFSDSYLDSLVAQTQTYIAAYQLHDKLLIESQNVTLLEKLQNAGVKQLFIYPPDFETGFNIATQLNLYGITISIDNLDEDKVKLAQSRNIKIATWNTHTRERNRRALQYGVDYIQTDRLDYMLDLIDKELECL